VLSISQLPVANSLSADPFLFRQKFDRAPFPLDHSLAGHPLFEIPRLLRLAQFLRRDVHNVTFDAGDVRVDQRWKYRAPNPYTLEEAMERIDCTGAWVILKHTELDPEYKAVMDAIMSDVERLSGRPLRDLAKNLEAQIMITSPRRITPYHFDNECNVLLQITGEKDLFVFDQTDREVLTEAELEKFWVGDWNAGEYKARCQERAYNFRLTPGAAVHIPVNAPHWVKNDANVSVSLSVNFEWKDELVYNVYRANYFLRKMGMQPHPPGRSPFSDSLKNAVMGLGFVPIRDTAKRAVRFVRRVKSASRVHPSRKSAAV
jgi:hypothetical protein